MAKEISLTDTNTGGLFPSSSPFGTEPASAAEVSGGSRFLWCILGDGGSCGGMHTPRVLPGMVAGALPLLCLQAGDSVAAHAGSSS